MRRKTPIRRRRLHGPKEVTDRILDEACRAVVFARDGHKCVKCGGTSYLQWAHVYSRRYRCLRWAPMNSMVLCAGCHLIWHHRPTESVLWWIGKYGEQTDAMLRATLKSPGKIDRKLTLIWLQNELKRLKRATVQD